MDQLPVQFIIRRRANPRNVSQHTLYSVQYTHINLTLIHSRFYCYADTDQNQFSQGLVFHCIISETLGRFESCLLCLGLTWSPHFRSEHERHSPECPYVKGEYTENVPMAGNVWHLSVLHGDMDHYILVHIRARKKIEIHLSSGQVSLLFPLSNF